MEFDRLRYRMYLRKQHINDLDTSGVQVVRNNDNNNKNKTKKHCGLLTIMSSNIRNGQ